MGKRALLIKWLEDIRASYWFLPTVLAVFAVLLSHVMLILDQNEFLLTDAWRTTEVEGARSTLALISQSVIGVTGVMFSMTIVAVSFASGNFGPRLIGNFMRDRGNQWSLGILIATFVYTLLILRAVGANGTGEPFVPHLSMLLAFTLTALSVLTMIFFVHHIPEIINVSNISAKLGRQLQHALETLIDAQNEDSGRATDPFPKTEPDGEIFIKGDGYLQTWDRARLAEIAEEHDIYFKQLHTGGSFITAYSPVLKVWCKEPLSDEVTENIRDCFALGHTPTEKQNLLFIVQQLVEMIARALSPGVNDPFTAINCMNWLYVGMLTGANYKGGLQSHKKTRMDYPSLDFEDLLTAGFRAPLPYVRMDELTRKHLCVLLNRLLEETKQDEFDPLIMTLLKEATGEGASKNDK